MWPSEGRFALAFHLPRPSIPSSAAPAHCRWSSPLPTTATPMGRASGQPLMHAFTCRRMDGANRSQQPTLRRLALSPPAAARQLARPADTYIHRATLLLTPDPVLVGGCFAVDERAAKVSNAPLGNVMRRSRRARSRSMRGVRRGERRGGHSHPPPCTATVLPPCILFGFGTACGAGRT